MITKLRDLTAFLWGATAGLFLILIVDSIIDGKPLRAVAYATVAIALSWALTADRR